VERWRAGDGGRYRFQGDGEGILHGYDAASGREIWRFDAKLGIVGAPITYVVGASNMSRSWSAMRNANARRWTRSAAAGNMARSRAGC